MNPLSSIFLGLGILISLSTVAEGENQQGPPLVQVDFNDGSRLIGSSFDDLIQIRSESLGRLQIPIERIKQIKFDKEENRQATVTLKNDDTLKGVIDAPAFKMQTIFGAVTMNVDRMTDLHFQSKGTLDLDWERLPFPRNCPWSGAPLAHTSVDAGGDIVLQGEPVQTKNTFTLPITFGFELNLEKILRDGDDLIVELVPEDHPKDLEGECIRIDCRLCFGAQQCDGTDSISLFHRNDSKEGSAEWRENLPDLAQGKTHRLSINATADDVTITVDDKVYDAGSVTIPYQHFRIYLWNWQPSSHIRLSNFIVH